MNERIVVDTGILVAAFDQRDPWSAWTGTALKDIQSPLLTCEPVLAETWFLLRHLPLAWTKIEKWMDLGFLQVAFDLNSHRSEVFALMKKYTDLPMSLADACLVTMIEQRIGDRVFTLDEHFRIYRHSGRRVVPVLMPKY